MKKKINEASAAEVAAHLNLVSLPYGRWADQQGNLVAQTENGKLVRTVPKTGELEAQTAIDAQKAREKEEKEQAASGANSTAPAASTAPMSTVDPPPAEHKPTGMSAKTAGKVASNVPGADDVRKINGTSQSRPAHVTEESLKKFLAELSTKKVRDTRKLSEDDIKELERHVTKPHEGFDAKFVPYAVKNVISPEVVFGFDLTITTPAKNGKWWVGTDDKLRHVKYYETDGTHGYCEHLAASIYADLGIPVANSSIFTYGAHGSAHASEYVQGQVLSLVKTREALEAILKGFAADVLLANWDVIGHREDNIIVTEQGVPVRIDTGGTLLFRGVNSRKTTVVSSKVLEDISEWKVFSTSIHSQYHQVFQVCGLEHADDLGERAVTQIDAILALESKIGGWDRYVNQILRATPQEDRTLIIAMLTKRTIGLAEKREQILQGS